MDYSEPFLWVQEVVPSCDFVHFERIRNDLFVASTSSELVVFQFCDILVEVCRRKVFSKILDLKCHNSFIYVVGGGYLDILILGDDGLEVSQSVRLCSGKEIERRDIGHRIVVCDKGIVCTAIQENFSLFPLSDNTIRYDQRKDMNVPTSTIWDFDIIGNSNPESDFVYVVIISSNFEQKRNDLRFLKTNFRGETQKLGLISPIQSADRLLCRVLSVPSRNGHFVTVHGQCLTMFRIVNDSSQKIGEIVILDTSPDLLITSLGWCGDQTEMNKMSLLVGCENGDIFSVSNLFGEESDQDTNKRPEKTRICQNLPVTRGIFDITVKSSRREESNDDEDEDDNEEEIEGEGESMKDEPDEEEEDDDDDDDEEETTRSIFCVFEKSKSIVFEYGTTNETNESEEGRNTFSAVYPIPSVSPILDFDVSHERREFLFGSAHNLCHMERGIQCGLMFQSPKDSYPGISRLFITKSELDESSVDSLIFLSCGQVRNTNILRITEDGEIVPLDILSSTQQQVQQSFETNDDTIQVGCVLDDYVLQVTSKKALLVQKTISPRATNRLTDDDDDDDEEDDDEENVSWKLVSFWNSRETITHASISPFATVIGSSSNHIQVLELSSQSQKPVVSLRSETWVGNGEEITCISKFLSANYFAVGFFSGHIFVYDIQNLIVKVNISMRNILPEEAQETCCVESLVIRGIPDREEIIIVFAGLRNGWVVIQEMFITEREEAIIKRSFVEKIGVEPVHLVPCPNSIQVAAVSSRAVMLRVSPSLISILPLGLIQHQKQNEQRVHQQQVIQRDDENISLMSPLYTSGHQDTILTVTKDERLEIWKMNPSVKYITNNYLHGEQCYRIFFLEFLNCYLFFSQNVHTRRCQVGVFFKENDGLRYQHSSLHQFGEGEKPYGFCEWMGDSGGEESSTSTIGTSESTRITPKKKKKKKSKIMIDEDEDEEEEKEEEPYQEMGDEDEDDKKRSSTSENHLDSSKQYCCIGTTKNVIYKLEINETQEQTSKKRVFNLRMIQFKNLSHRREEMNDEDEEEEQRNEQANDDDEGGIVFCIRRFKSKYFIASSSRKLYLMDRKLNILSQSHVRHFVSGIECLKSEKDESLSMKSGTVHSIVNVENDDDNSLMMMRRRSKDGNDDENIYVTDRYDSMIVLRIEEHTKSFTFIQSDKSSRCNMRPRIFDSKKDGSSNLVIGTDRSSNEFFVLQFKEDELERKILESKKNESGVVNDNVDIEPEDVLLRRASVTSEIHVFSEINCVSSLFLEDIPIQVKVWRHPQFEHEIVMCGLLSGQIFQFGVIFNRLEYMVLSCLESAIDQFLKSLIVQNNQVQLDQMKRCFQPILGTTYLQSQQNQNVQRIINRDYLNVFRMLPNPWKLQVINEMNKSFEEEEIMPKEVTIERIMFLLDKFSI